MIWWIAILAIVLLGIIAAARLAVVRADKNATPIITDTPALPDDHAVDTVELDIGPDGLPLVVPHHVDPGHASHHDGGAEHGGSGHHT